MLWRVLLVQFMCVILLRMACGRVCLCCESYLLECMSVGGCSAEKTSSVSCEFVPVCLPVVGI